MRIAIFTDLYLEVAGGIPSSIKAQKEALKKLGHKVTIFCPGFKTNDKDVVLLPTSKILKINGAPLARSPKVIVNFIKQNYPDFNHKFDLIHSHYEAGASIAAVIIANQFHLPLVQTMHGREDMAIQINVPTGFKTVAGFSLNHIHKHYLKYYAGESVLPIKITKDSYLAPTKARANMWELIARQANCANAVITPSKHFANKLENYHVFKPITVISNGINDDLATSHDWQVRELKNDDPIKIIWYSRVSREKRMLPFLEALNIAKSKNVNFEFTVLGDGNELKKAKRYVIKNGLENNVAFLGAVKHEKVLEYLENQHLSVINSYGFDTQGLTILEGIVVGLPSLYADPDMDEIIVQGGGIRPKNNTPREMAKTLVYISKNPEVIAKMSKACLNAQKDVLQSTQIKKLIKLYENTINNYQV